ncbi:MAG: ABC transporter ATP-binding protein [Rhizobiales bacterium]|nr:ABC transporter ATP-binding protein [Rhizobacter sp.]
MTAARSAGLLRIDNLTVWRGNKVVVNEVSLEVRAGQVTALLGPNGAGKSSLVLALAGVLPIAGGRVVLNGEDIAGQAPDAIRRHGVATVPEGHQVLTLLSVDDNLKAAGTVLSRRALESALQQAYAVFPELAQRRNQAAGTMSGGQQQMLALAQGLIGRPAFMLIDEMSLGLAPIVVRRLMGVVAELARGGVGILLIEQFTQMALGLADHACVMSRAVLRYSGDPATLQRDAGLLHAAYLAAPA